MRTTPLEDWKGAAERFDEQVRKAAEDILSFPLGEDAWKQACLTPQLGGIGLRRVQDHAVGAFAASWRSSLTTSGEDWEEPPEVAKTEVGTQREASYRPIGMPTRRCSTGPRQNARGSA